MSSEAMRVLRKVKIGKVWTMAPVPVDRAGRPDSRHVLHKGNLVPVSAGTFYLDHGHGRARKRQACGSDPENVRRALRTQIHVLELRRRGMDVGDAPEIEESRRSAEGTLAAIAREFRATPPNGFTVKTVKKYINALETFKDWAASIGVSHIDQVDKRIISRWVSHLQAVERLDATTIVPKVRIVLAELRAAGKGITLLDRDLPTPLEREREIYTPEELLALFAACTLEEYERFQTFLVTGQRRMEVAFLAWADINPKNCTVRVTAKKHLGFVPKAFHERTIPVPRAWVELMQARGERLACDGVGLVFGTSRGWTARGSKGGKADKKMLEKLKQVARREGLNCGQCLGFHKGEAVSCKTHAICRRWGLHKFRHTYATSMLRDQIDIVTLSKWLGHKDLATTRIYLRALEAETAQPQVEGSTIATRFSGQVPAEQTERRAYRVRASDR